MSDSDKNRVVIGDFGWQSDRDMELDPAPFWSSIPDGWKDGETRAVFQVLLIEGKPYNLTITATRQGDRLMGYLDTLALRGPMPPGGIPPWKPMGESS